VLLDTILSLASTTCSFLLRLAELFFHSIVSFPNLMHGAFPLCKPLYSNAFFVASSALSFPVISKWLGIHISLTLPFSWSRSSLICLVYGFFVHLVPSTAIIVLRESVAITVYCSYSFFVFRYVNCFDNGFLFGTKYRYLAFNSVFYRRFGCDDCVTDSLILQRSIREYLQPFVILALQCPYILLQFVLFW
jgi:hypothetical protein